MSNYSDRVDDFFQQRKYAEQKAEIERLRAWKDEHSRTEGGECPYCEIDRLRAALEDALPCLAEHDPEVWDIAREALK